MGSTTYKLSILVIIIIIIIIYSTKESCNIIHNSRTMTKYMYISETLIKWETKHAKRVRIRNGAICGSGLTKVKYFTVTRRHVSPHMLSQGDINKNIAQEWTQILRKLNNQPVVIFIY